MEKLKYKYPEQWYFTINEILKAYYTMNGFISKPVHSAFTYELYFETSNSLEHIEIDHKLIDVDYKKQDLKKYFLLYYQQTMHRVDYDIDWTAFKDGQTVRELCSVYFFFGGNIVFNTFIKSNANLIKSFLKNYLEVLRYNFDYIKENLGDLLNPLLFKKNKLMYSFVDLYLLKENIINYIESGLLEDYTYIVCNKKEDKKKP